MTDDFESQEAPSSGELWSKICSDLPEVRGETSPETTSEFNDSFQPAAPHVNGHSNGTLTSSTTARWEPMEDSEVYIASLENRLKKLRGQSSDMTSREMLRSLSQAKKECWDRFLHDAQTSELFQSGDLDQSAVEHFKRWLIPEKVAISAEELEYLLRPPHNTEGPESNHTHNGEETDKEIHNSKDDDTLSPEK
ncbi:coiled-coil domain-containing protein 32 [Genypterus blacodes]|uniref:coiled-coil domain-containing protein 32 n=1 Tax=Genypterus blacodes TaxID=154954 RepID=UPI003F75D6E6